MPAQHTAWQQVQTGLTHQRQHKLTESWWPCSSTVTVSKGNQTMNVIIIHNELTSVGHHWWTLCLSMANIHNTGEHWIWVWQTFTPLVNKVYEYNKHSQHWWTRCMNMTNIHNTGEHCVRIRQTFTITHYHSQHPTRCLQKHCTWCPLHASCLPTTVLGNTSCHPAHNQSTQWNITLALAQPVNNSSRKYLWLL